MKTQLEARRRCLRCRHRPGQVATKIVRMTGPILSDSAGKLPLRKLEKDLRMTPWT
jgi:hypothetical protein